MSVASATLDEAPPRPVVTYQAGWIERIPDELKNVPHWVVWRYEWRLNAKNDGKWTKVLYQPLNLLVGKSRRAKADTPSTWSSFTYALRAYQEYRDRRVADRMDGTGFVFDDNDPYLGIDLDNCLAGDGALLDWARERIERLGRSRSERSPGGRGIKTFYRGVLPPKGKKDGRRRAKYGDDESGAIELYHRARFFAITGDTFDDSPITEPNAQALADLIAEVDAGNSKSKAKRATKATTEKPADATQGDAPKVSAYAKANLNGFPDDELLTWARHASNGAKFIALYDDGDWRSQGHPSQSEADFALLVMLAYWTGENEARMELLFGRSALGQRDKWTGRPDHRRSEIAKAIHRNAGKVPDLTQTTIEFKGGSMWVGSERKPPPDEPRWAGNDSSATNGQSHHHANGTASSATTDDESHESPNDRISDEDMGIVPLSSVKAQAVQWLWRYRLEKGCLALMAGDAGIGKSQILLKSAAIVSVGGEWPDGAGKASPGNIVIVAAEDRPDRTIRPRLEAMGADIDRVTIVKARYIVRKPGKEPEVHFTDFRDLGYWNTIFDRIKDVSLFIVDPLPSYLGRGVNDSKNIEIRQVLEPFLHEVIEPRDICMWGNTHLNKSVDSKTPLHRITGSIAYGALPRNVHFVVRDPEDDERRLFKQAKCNEAPDGLPALAFRVERHDITSEGETIETAVPVFEPEPVKVNLGTAMAGAGKSPGPAPDRTCELAEALFDYLNVLPGDAPKGDVFREMGDRGFLGKQDEKGMWSNGKALSRAIKFIPRLEHPRNGHCVAEYEVKKPGNRWGSKFLRLDLDVPPATDRPF